MLQDGVNMANVSISEAARVTGKSRATIQRHIKVGKLSVGKDVSGNPIIDTSELLRVYGSMQAESGAVGQDETPTVGLLKEQLRQAHEREEWLKKQLEAEQEFRHRMLPPGQEKKGLWARIFGK
jgi:hypothetical protein